MRSTQSLSYGVGATLVALNRPRLAGPYPLGAPITDGLQIHVGSFRKDEKPKTASSVLRRIDSSK
jgi:hypothetical protein